MRFKRSLKAVIAFSLAVVTLLTMFGCKKTKPQADEDGHLPLQETNKRYYFQQGYRTDWNIVKQNEDDYMYDPETGLVLQLAPVEVLETDADGNVTKTGNPIEGVEYCVYYYTSKNIYLTTTTNDVWEWVLDEDNAEFYFNNHHFNNGAPRDTFLLKGESSITYAKFSKLQFKTQAYTFTRDGDQWQGVMKMVMSGTQYFIVTYEALADKFSAFEEQYDEIVGDFRKEGWETSNVG